MKVKEVEIVIKSDCLLRFACSDVFFTPISIYKLRKFAIFANLYLSQNLDVSGSGCLGCWMSGVLDVSGAGYGRL